MIVGLRSADACGWESCRDRCMYRREVGWGVGRRYVPAVELDSSSGWIGGEIALGWNTAKGEVAQPGRCENVMGRRFRAVDWPAGTAVWVGEAVAAHAGVEEPRIPMKTTAGGRVGPGGLGS